MERALRAIHWCTLAGVYGLLVVKAFFVFAPTYDFLSYHLPRGLMFFHRTSFVPEQCLLEVYKGYPPLPDFLEGLLAAASGRLSAANGVGMIGMGCAIGGVLLVGAHESVIRWFLTFCLAFPLIVLHLTIGYVDLFTGAMLLLGFAGLCGVHGDVAPRRAAVVMIGGLSTAMFSKYTAWPPAVILASFGALFLLRAMRRDSLSIRATAALLILLFAGSVAYPVRNILLWGTPTYPLQIGAARLKAPSDGIEVLPSSDVPPYLVENSAPVRFIHSALELNRLSAREPYRWNYDQWAGPQSNHQRMGGWFFVSVIIVTLMLASGAASGAIPAPLVAAHAVSVAAVAMIPRYFELRYAFFVPLDSLFLLAAFRGRFALAVRSCGQAALTVCAVYVLWCLRSSAYSLDFRPPERFAPEAARAFWQTALGKSHSSPLPIGVHDPDGIYWSGPTFTEIPVEVVDDDDSAE